jgi:hypothetical protein
MSYDMIISYTHDPHFDFQMLKIVNTNNQPNGQKKIFLLTTPKIELWCFQNFHMI